MKKTIKIIEGDIFIIPNAATFNGSKISEFAYNMHKEDYERTGNLAKEGQPFIECWTTGQGVDNWSCHYTAFNQKVLDIKDNRWPDYFPADLFAGKKEGDVIEFTAFGKEFRLRLKQKGYRYSSFGNFEDAYERVLAYGKVELLMSY